MIFACHQPPNTPRISCALSRFRHQCVFSSDGCSICACSRGLARRGTSRWNRLSNGDYDSAKIVSVNRGKNLLALEGSRGKQITTFIILTISPRLPFVAEFYKVVTIMKKVETDFAVA